MVTVALLVVTFVVGFWFANPTATFFVAAAIAVVSGAGFVAIQIRESFEKVGFLIILALALFGLVAIVVYSTQVADPLRALSVLLIFGGAAAITGAVTGFLFGIPRTGAKQSASQNFEPNTNLEQISDWLTKILVGVGLVQLREVPSQIQRLLDFLGPAIGGGEPSAKAFVLALLIFFSTGGFLVSYIATRHYPGAVGLTTVT